MPAGLAEPRGVGAAKHHQITAHRNGTQCIAALLPELQLGLWRQLGLFSNHRPIQIGILIGIAAATRAEGHHRLQLRQAAEMMQRHCQIKILEPRPSSKPSSSNGCGMSHGID